VLALHMHELVDEGLFRVCLRIHAAAGRAPVALRLLDSFLPVIILLYYYIMSYPMVYNAAGVCQLATHSCATRCNTSTCAGERSQDKRAIITRCVAVRQAR